MKKGKRNVSGYMGSARSVKEAVTFKACSCQGENPNCYKCGGRWYLSGNGTDSGSGIDWSLLPKRTLRASKQPNTSKQPRFVKTILCPKCGVDVTSLYEHFQKVHRRRKPMQPPVMKLKPCPYCGVSVKKSRLQLHIARLHRGSQNTILSKQLPPLLQNSLSKKAVKPMRTTQSKKQKMGMNRHSFYEMNKEHSIPKSKEDNMDFSRPFAHAFRESGKFGSYPSQDDFGDESKP